MTGGPVLMTVEFPERKIDRSSPVPFYFQLERILEDEITSGRWAPNSQLPSEHVLGEYFQVSRTTIRQALDELESAGLIRREKGRGTYVNDGPPETWFLQSSQGFYEEATRRGHRITSRVLRRELVELPAWAATALGLQVGAAGLTLERLRWVDDHLVMYVVNHLPERFAETLLGADLNHGSLYRSLADLNGVVIAGGRRMVEAVAATSEIARLLEVEEGSPLLFLESISWDEAGEPVECYRAWHRPDRTKIEVQVVHQSLASAAGVDPATIRWERRK